MPKQLSFTTLWCKVAILSFSRVQHQGGARYCRLSTYSTRWYENTHEGLTICKLEANMNIMSLWMRYAIHQINKYPGPVIRYNAGLNERRTGKGNGPVSRHFHILSPNYTRRNSLSLCRSLGWAAWLSHEDITLGIRDSRGVRFSDASIEQAQVAEGERASRCNQWAAVFARRPGTGTGSGVPW